MMRPLVILGTGGNAYDLLDLVEAINGVTPTWDVIGFLDDAKPPGTPHLGLPILGSLDEAWRLPPGLAFVNTIGCERTFRRLPEILASTGLDAGRFATLVHPAASVSARAGLGRGVVVGFGAAVSGGARIGDLVALGPGCLVGHDAAIRDYSILAPGAVLSDSVRVGRGCYLGSRSTVRQYLRVGDGALVGMCAVVVREVPPGSTVAGNPARIVRFPASLDRPPIVPDPLGAPTLATDSIPVGTP
jgi:sugar O-acyltransferase (sialic acid O-acetyltransferase NeuD family)